MADENYIGEGMTIRGSVEFSGKLNFAAAIEGELIGKAASVLTVLETAKVRGEIKVDNLILHGKVNGNVTVVHADLKNPCIIDGDLVYETITMEKGATVLGVMKKASPPETAVQPPPLAKSAASAPSVRLAPSSPPEKTAVAS